LITQAVRLYRVAVTDPFEQEGRRLDSSRHDVDTSFGTVRLEMDWYVHDGRPEPMQRTAIDLPPGVPLTSGLLRELAGKVPPVIRQQRAAIIGQAVSPPSRAVSRLSPRAAQAAEIYEAAVDAGSSAPVVAVQEQMGITYFAASNLIARARRAGRLDQTDRGAAHTRRRGKK
jgi:hypothetical protein